MKSKILMVCAIGAAVSLLAGCGGGGTGTSAQTPDKVFSDIPVPGVTAGTNFSFDIGTVANGVYYVTDRNNKAIDVVNGSLAISQIKGTGANAFAGCFPTANCAGANNGISGPDGIDFISAIGRLFAGDVDGVKVIDPVSATVTSTIKVTSIGFRADEGCYDPDHGLYMISTPDAPLPLATFINVNTLTIAAQVQWVDTDGNPAGGNEACAYDTTTKSFYVNNDATIANPRGEVEVIPAASITALPPGTTTKIFSLPGVKRFPLDTCDPTGLAFGPGRDMLVECRPGNAGDALTSVIMDRDTGANLATIALGGGDQVAYDSRLNRYYVAASRWHKSGVNDLGGGCSATNLCTPVLGIIDAGARTLIGSEATGNNAHSVAVDTASGHVFMPYSSATAPAGCATCTANGFINGGITVFLF